MFVRVICLAAVLSCSSMLTAAPPSVERISPAAGQRGTSFQLTVVGAGLQDAVEAVLYDSAITCERVEAKSENELVLHLNATADCEPGLYAVRIRSAEGLSELHAFRISTLPIVAEIESNDADEDAQQMTSDCTIVGTVEAGDIDSFRVTLKKGDRLSAEAEAMRAGGAMFDAVLNVMGPDGAWLVAVDDTPLRRQDPFVSLLVPTDGDYIVQLHESNFEGDESSRYALHVGSFPSPAFVFPAGGPAGESVPVVFGGDASGPISQSVLVNGLSSATTMIFAEHDGRRSATGLPFRVSSFGNVIEAEPNESATDLPADASSLPIALNGRLDEPGDVDCFRIHGAAGQKLSVEVFASRLGSPVDSLLEISDSAGRIVASGDDGICHDSHVDVTFPASGEYVVRVTDKRGNGGEAHFYRIEISPFRPQLTAFLSRPDRRSQDRQAISVPRGNRVVTFLACQRDGFSSDVHLSASQLPDGVMMSSAMIPTDRFWVPVIVEAAADAPIGGALVGIEASGTAGTETVIGQFRQIVDLVAASADQLFQAAEVDRLAVAVVDRVPYSITLQTPATTLAADGTLELQINAIRDEGFDGPLEVTLPFLPPWVDGPDKVVIAAGESQAIYPLRAWPKAAPRTWLICAEARAGLNAASEAEDMRSEERATRRRKPVVRTAVASNLVSLTIAASPVSGTIGTVVAEQGQASKVRCDLRIDGTLPESMTAVLEGLPNRVSAQDVVLRPTDSQVEFELLPEPSSPVGTFADVTVRLTGLVDGQAVSWRIGRGGVLKIEASGMLVTDEAGRPLSRLDVLRREAEKKR